MNLITENRKRELLNLFETTPFWQDVLAPEKKANVLELLNWANTTIIDHNGVFWIGRIFQRAFVYSSDDKPGDDKWEKKRAILNIRGYSRDRIYEDIGFFVGNKQNRGQFRPVFEHLREVSKQNIIIRNALSNIKYSNNNNIDYTVHEVYRELNTVSGLISDEEKLPQGTPIFKFKKDGSMWVALDVASCKEEGALMNHCGNVGNANNKDQQMWSYRVPSEKVKGFFTPKLTFIYNVKTKSLGEMKGFANAKPDRKYYGQIVTLLAKPGLVDHLEGSGYAGQNNFSLNDINDDLFTSLYKHNPDLVNAQLTKGDTYQQLNSHKQELLKRLKQK